jgi:hypothetical protein
MKKKKINSAPKRQGKPKKDHRMKLEVAIELSLKRFGKAYKNLAG